MIVTTLSSKGQVIIPKPIRSAHHWEPGQAFVVVDLGDGIALRPEVPFGRTALKDAAASLKYTRPSKSLEDMEKAIEQGVRKGADDRR